jgi:hypothetical protein
MREGDAVRNVIGISMLCYVTFTYKGMQQMARAVKWSVKLPRRHLKPSCIVHHRKPKYIIQTWTVNAVAYHYLYSFVYIGKLCHCEKLWSRLTNLYYLIGVCQSNDIRHSSKNMLEYQIFLKRGAQELWRGFVTTWELCLGTNSQRMPMIGRLLVAGLVWDDRLP